MESLFLMELENQPCSNRLLKVRLARKWLETGEDDSVLGLNLIMNDQYDNRMHCWIPSPIFVEMDKAFVKGGLYSIGNFLITPYTGKYRCFEAGLHIVFTITTVISPLIEPFYVVGIIEDVKYPQIVSNRNNNQQIIRDFVITDLVDCVKVRFWDQFALHFDTLFSEATVRPIIITTISSCKMNRNNYSGVTTLTNMPATSIHMNSNCPRAETLRNSSKREGQDDNNVDDEYESGRHESLEKSLTNLNIGISKILRKVGELSCSYKEFAENFELEQKYLRDELKMLSSKREGQDDNNVDDEYESGRHESLEKSLTNLNIGISKILRKVGELSCSYKEFAENFELEQKYLRDELKMLSSKREGQDDNNADDEYESGRHEALEKSLTNLNIGISKILRKVGELNCSYKEFAENFELEQKYLRDELKMLRSTADHLKKYI
ncbi:hypothetical protein ACET3Z_000869 [Daucus carota]